MVNSFKQFESDEELVKSLGSTIVEQLKDGIIENGAATLAVSGGNSPRPLFKFLSEQELLWKAVTITLVDERWLSDDHKDANANLVKTTLLQNKAAQANFLPLYTGANSPYDAEQSLNDELERLSYPLDVVILGMGEDGHTASFFPNATTLKQALFPEPNQHCTAITPPEAPYDRMTLTLPTILNSKRLFLHFTGQKKLKVLEKAKSVSLDAKNLEQNLEQINQYPIRSVLPQNAPSLEIYYRE